MILVFGSLNIDKIYKLDEFVRPGQTVSAEDYYCCCGGKGFNAAVAVARAGGNPAFAGAVGPDGGLLLEELGNCGISDRLIKRSACDSGHAVIQVDARGQNCIIVAAGANRDIDEGYVDGVLAAFGPGDLVILQNEISCVEYIMRQARGRGMRVAFNPSPITRQLARFDLSPADFLFINAGEGQVLSGEAEPMAVLAALHRSYPAQNVMLTLGEAGALYLTADGELLRSGIYAAPVADTTAAGDTFMGYFLTELTRSGDAARALELAAVASGIAVSRKGASPSIPTLAEVLETAARAGVEISRGRLGQPASPADKSDL